MKKIVANTIYEDPPFSHYCGLKEYSQERRIRGGDHPQVAHTMIGMKRLHNIHECVKNIILNEIPGDCIETGVWRGGATILMRAILKAYGDTTRVVWVADSFEGVPPPNPDKYPADSGLELTKAMPYLAVSLEQVQANFKKYDLLDNQVVFLKGYFCDTLPQAPIEKLALLRLDGDLYESTIDALVTLYPKLSVGGYVIVDDYGIKACAQAVTDYRAKFNITDTMVSIDGESLYWQKTK